MSSQVLSLWKGVVTVRSPARSVDEILRETAAEHGLTVQGLLSPIRSRKYVRARRDAIHKLHTTTSPSGATRSLPKIGQIMGLDHTTVLYALKRIADIELHGDAYGNGSFARCKPCLAKREVEAA